MEDTYKIRAKCKNCGWHGFAEIKKGVEIKNATCPDCGCGNIVRTTRIFRIDLTIDCPRKKFILE